MPGRCSLTEPLGYLDFMKLLADARLVLTDSGGIQEETTVLGVPCLTLRENTERPVTVEQGTNHLVGLDPERIIAAARRTVHAPKRAGARSRAVGRPRCCSYCGRALLGTRGFSEGIDEGPIADHDIARKSCW